MHELSITQSLLRQVLDTARSQSAKRVVRVTLQVGEETGIVPDCVSFYFERLAQGTAAEGAVLEFSMVPLRIRCPRCGRDASGVEDLCGCNAGGEVISGGELVIDSVEVEDA